MGNITTYVREYGTYTLKEKAWNDVDMLVLAQLSYMKFDGLVPAIREQTEGVSLREIRKKMNPGVIFADFRYREANSELLQAMCESERFGRMRLNFYENRIRPEEESQFCAVTLWLDGMPPVIVFRGTDENIAGWKEDFNMALSKPVPGQRLASLYLNQAVLRIDGSFLVCGHSKGGNLAVYSVLQGSDEVHRRTEAVYSFDGPGFRPEVLDGTDYEKIKGKLHRLLPHSSLVGMLLQNPKDYLVVESSKFGAMQHDPYSWIVDGNNFRYANSVRRRSKKTNEVVNKWIFAMDEKELEGFISTFFKVIQASGATTVLDFINDWKKCTRAVLAAMRELDEESRKRNRAVFKEFFLIVRDSMKNSKKKDGN